MREVTLRLPAELIEKARTRAVAEERTVGWILRKLIANASESSYVDLYAELSKKYGAASVDDDF